ncbi:uncharacterized protein Stacl isoform X2 [Atheta coriaria]|uniref:uncharacterized protein Stacl isoform X2 n=1 Tax=Dalotia coriaria TaxID=877792 RepID=UPI0031F42B38
MYVIFPADEVVYLSYGRLIYIPTVADDDTDRPHADNGIPHEIQQQVEQAVQERRQRQCSEGSAPLTPTSTPTPTSNTPTPPKAPERTKRNSNASSINKKKPNGNLVPPPATTLSPLKKSATSVSLQTAAATNQNSPKAVKIAAASRDKRLSYSDFLPVHKCLKPQNLQINPASNSTFGSTSLLGVPKSPSPFVARKPLDFDELFDRPEPVSLSPTSEEYESRLRSQTPEKSPTKKKAFFLPKLPTKQPPEPPRLKRSTEFGISVRRRQQEAHYPAEGVAGAPPATATAVKMAASAVHDAATLRELSHPGYNEPLKGHNAVTFKLIRTVSDFTQQLSQMYEQHAAELQHLVANFRKRNGELRKERPACASSIFHTWETLLQEVEIDSQALGDIASILGRQVSRPLLEKSFYRKIQSRKVFTHRESYETIIAKTEEKLVKCRQEYKNAYVMYLSSPSTETLSGYFNSHNAYVQQLHATNGMLDEYGKETLPQLLQELEEIYTDLCATLTESVIQGAEVVAARAMEQNRRYEGLISQCKAANGTSDLVHLARALPVPQGRAPPLKRLFVPPQPPPQPQEGDGEDGPIISNENIPPPLKDELVIDRLSAVQVRPSHDALRKEAVDLDLQIRQINDALETLIRLQQRSVEAQLFNKANEIQEDISMKRFDLRVAQLHLSAIHAQKELFSNKLDNASGAGGGGDSGRERKMSNASQGSMKTKWLKAFKSLKTPPPEADKKNGSAATKELLKGDPDAHNFQEYTYKKITPCDVCSQVLRGHTKQGLKCRICKLNVHLDCQDKANKCTAKARLLRRQKSTSEIETKAIEPSSVEEEKASEVDLIYQVLKQAGEISSNKTPPQSQQGHPSMMQQVAASSGATPTVGIQLERGATPSSSGQNLNRLGLRPPSAAPRQTGSSLCVVNPAPCSTSSGMRSMRNSSSAGNFKTETGQTHNHYVAPHSPRRQKLNLRMKSLSLDSPESTEHVQRRQHRGAAATSDPHSNQGSSSRIQLSQVGHLGALRLAHHCHQVQVASNASESINSTPSSPVHNRRLLSAKNIRMSSVELPDDNEKSPSSASTSPCPSPVGGKHKPHRLLPTNLYVVLYNFKSRHQDELDLKAGYKVTVIDTSDPDWWKGKCLGRVGYFPSKYCSKLSPGEKPLQVTHNLQVSDGDNGLMLLRDQIVIQIGEELDGMVMIRSGDNRQGVCPVKFLQEV